MKLANDNIIKSFKRRRLDKKKPVQVYKNLKLGCWSIRQDRLVVAHADRLCLYDCKFVVIEAYRQRVINTGHKNIHAWVQGYITESGCGTTAKASNKTGEVGRLPVKIVYNPYENDSFVSDEFVPKIKIKSAEFVVLNEQGVFAAYVN